MFRPTPSWLDSGPGLFLSAIKAGSDAGNEIARLGQAQRDNEARRAIAMAELASQEGLAGERIRQAKELAEMENATRLQIEGQRGQRQDRAFDEGQTLKEARLALDQARASDLNAAKERTLGLREQLAAQRQSNWDADHGDFEPSAMDVKGAPGVKEVRDSRGRVHIINPGWMERLMQGAAQEGSATATNAPVKFRYEPGKGLIKIGQ